jgi:hypothetical protein
MQVVVINPRNFSRGLAGFAFPFVEVADFLIHLPIARIIFRLHHGS